MNFDDLSTLNPNTFIVFGTLLLFGVVGGILAGRIRWLPTITAFMLLGLIVGPHGTGLITDNMLHEATILVDIALGLILYKLGHMLHLRRALRSRWLLLVSLSESLVAFALVSFVAALILKSAVMACLIGAIAVSSSPAVLVHVADEMNADGPIVARAKTLVALNNIWAFLLFSMVQPFILPSESVGVLKAIFTPIYSLCGAAAVGVFVSWVITRVARVLREEDNHYRFALSIGGVMLTVGMALMIHASLLFAPLVLGVGTRYFETKTHRLSQVGLGEGGDLFFIILFVIAGAKMDLVNLYSVGLIALVLAVLRYAGKLIGLYGAGKYFKLHGQKPLATSMLLAPMAGMAIGLITATNQASPDYAGRAAAIIFGMVALFETVGPFIVKRAILMTGEANSTDNDEPQPETV